MIRIGESDVPGNFGNIFLSRFQQLHALLQSDTPDKGGGGFAGQCFDLSVNLGMAQVDRLAEVQNFKIRVINACFYTIF